MAIWELSPLPPPGAVVTRLYCGLIYFLVYIVGREGATGGWDWRGKRRFHVPVITLKVISVAVTFLL